MDFALLVNSEAPTPRKGGAGAASSIMRRRRRPFKAGDLAIVVERHDSFVPVYLRPGEKYMNRFGAFHHDDVLGRPFGSKITSRPSASAPTHLTKAKRSRHVRALLPNPELWTASLRHRTQICQDLDQAMVVFMLGLRPGAQVLESGTGTGAMSHSLMRAVSPSGHVHTFEFNETRAIMAREEFGKHQVSHLVTVHHADICQDLATPNSSLKPLVVPLEGKMDAVFLDVPKPWLAVPLARGVLKPNAPIATYSPCLEQVFKTCEALRAQGFHSIRTMEVRQKHLEVRRVSLPPVDFGSQEGRTAASVINAFGTGTGGAAAVEQEMDCAPAVAEEEGEEEANNEGQAAVGGKRKRGAGPEGGRLVAKARAVMRGHTAFLTFAVKSLGASTGGVFAPAAVNGKAAHEAVVVEKAPEA